MRGIGMVAVGPHASRLDGAAHAVGGVAIARPHAGAQAVERVVGDRDRVGFVLELGHRDDRPEDFFLEHAHLVVPGQDRRLDVIAAGQLAFEMGAFAAGQNLSAFLLANVEIGQDLLELVVGGLRADHGGHVKRMALLDLLGSHDRAVVRTKKIKQGHPLDMTTMIGAQASNDQLEKILSYFDIGKQEGAEVLTGGKRAHLEGELADGYYIQPTIFAGHNKMRVFQEEIFGPVVSVAKFKDEAEALSIANDTLYGLGAGVWTRNGNRAYRMGRAIQAGRVWTNCFHAYPAHAAFGGYKQSGIGRENHKM